jgi:PAS domain S-box-containing protein
MKYPAEYLYKFIKNYIYPFWIKQNLLKYLLYIPSICIILFLIILYNAAPFLYDRHNLNSGLLVFINLLSLFIVFSLYFLGKYMLRNLNHQELLLAESAFRKSMGDSILVGMVAINKNGKIVYVNPSFCSMTGFNEDELLGCVAPFPYWAQTDYKELYAVLNSVVLGNIPMNGIEMRLQRKAGSVFYVRMHSSILLGGNGEHIGWLNSAIDVTEQKRSREELSAAHRRFMTVVESLEVSVSILTTEDGKMMFYNRYYQQSFLNTSSSSLYSSSSSSKFTNNKTNKAHIFLSSLSTYNSQLTALEWISNIMPKIVSDNSYDEIFYPELDKWFSVRTYPIQWVDGRIAQMMLAIDVTSIKQARQEAKINEEKWHFSNRLSNMGEMASSLAHEINQPLTAINNYCNGILERVKHEDSDKKITPDIELALKKASAQAMKASAIIQKLRNFVTKTNPQKKLENISLVVQEALALINFTIPHSNINIIQNIQKNIPHIYVDKILIEQVLVNLLKNAIEATMHKIDEQKDYDRLHTIELKIFIAASNSSYIQIHVVDEGVGINKDISDNLFNAFFSTKPEGMGMGLNICRSIIESHNGKLSAENNYRCGCTFKIQLPIN